MHVPYLLPIVKKTVVGSLSLSTMACSAVLMELCAGIFCCRGFDDEMRAVVARNLEGRGVNLHPRTNLTKVLLFVVLV